MKRTIDTLLHQALSPNEEPDSRLNQEIIQKSKENQSMKKRHIHSTAAAAAIICVLAVGSVSAVAAYRYLSPSQAAEIAENNSLAKAFESKNAIEINESQTSGGYRFTLLGMVSGKGLEPYIDTQTETDIQKDETYAVLAIENTDGTPMPDQISDSDGTFLASPFIKGKNPSIYNIYTLDGAYCEFSQDGIIYRILSCSNLEKFADQGVYLGVSEDLTAQEKAFLFDEQTGEISRNPDYTGINALFELPLDPAKADPAAAEAFFDKAENPSSYEEDISDMKDETVDDAELEKWISAINHSEITPEYLNTYAAPVEGTRQTLTPDEEGNVSWDVGDYGNGTLFVGTPSDSDWTAGKMIIPGYSHSGTIDSLHIDTFTYNDDGTVTYELYCPKNS